VSPRLAVEPLILNTTSLADHAACATPRVGGAAAHLKDRLSRFRT